MHNPRPTAPKLTVISGGRAALEREALAALFFDPPRFDEIKKRLFESPRPVLRLIAGNTNGTEPKSEI